MNLIRLDRYLSELGMGTRSEVKIYIRKQRVCVNGAIIRGSEYKVDAGTDVVTLDGKAVLYQKYEYYMLNKPMGVVSAVTDSRDQTVVELITESKRKGLFPVGRLDKDTEGLILITNDGSLDHQLLTPKKHVDKTYYAKIDGRVTNDDVKRFAGVMQIDETIYSQPARLEILESGEVSEILLTIQEGKFHQVKKMFEAVGKPVLYLKRVSIGTLQLDPSLDTGEYRELTEDEISGLKNSTEEIE